MPGAEKLEMEADFVMATFGRWTARTTTEAEAVTLVPDGEVPVAVPRFRIQPLSTSAWVVV